MTKRDRDQGIGLVGMVVIVVGLVGVSGGLAVGDSEVLVGASGLIALDQPRVPVEVYDVGPPEQSFGPSYYNTFLLDTGTNGLIAGPNATSEMLAEGFQTVAIYDEQGVAGTEPLNVSELYYFDFAGTDGVRNTLADVRTLSTTNTGVDLGGFDGIAGMPTMVNRVTALDMTVWSEGGVWMGVDFSGTVPAAEGTRYSVPLDLVEFPQDGQRQETDPLPTWAALPFLSAEMRYGANSSAGEYLADTGAQLSIVTTDTAIALGLDVNGNGEIDLSEAVGTTDLGGLGGTLYNVPLVLIEELALPTNEGADLIWTSLCAAVVDIPGISGVIGSEILTSGWLEAAFGGPDPGHLNHVIFDFQSAASLTGTMYLDLNPDRTDTLLIVGGDANLDGYVDYDDYLLLAANYGTTAGMLWPDGDFDFDFDVDYDDYLLLQANYYDEGHELPVIPEPLSLGLLAIGGAVVLSKRGLRRG